MSNFYITTSIPYVNSEPHVGFGMEIVMADVLARYMRQYKTPVIFCTGTDEHGGKIAEKAAEANITPKAYADKLSQSFRDLLPLLNISNDRFVRTTDEGHEQRAQIIWKNLSKHIYKGSYTGWYCVGHEEYFPEQVVKANKGVCPEHNRPYEKLQEENYFFKLSAFAPKVKEAIETGTIQIVPEHRKNEILALVKSGLEDISISRPKNKIAWGIAVPGDDTQVMYVWFEALMNYITILGYPEKQEFKDFWPANVQIIGKDILRFHAAIWPAMLMGLGLPLPRMIYVHGFITIEDKKMSKTLGNVVAPKDIVAKYGADTFRYFFTRHVPSYEDGDFSWSRLEAAHNNELADQLGNAVSRTAAMVSRYQKGVIGEIPAAEHDIAPYRQALESCRFDKALEEVWEQVKGLNQYIEEEKPWELAKAGDEEHLKEVLAYMVGALLEIAELLAPFMPATSEKIRELFSSGVLKEVPPPLFPKHDSKVPAAK
ncbi:MAG TPA: methionine--tRNA ligase [Candidatus Saccharimonadales bacterium]|nr:methionine--tRNA ligase [Candidatus Saccharimonadales bacterium]